MEISRPSNLSRYIQPIILATIKRYCASAADTAIRNVPSRNVCQQANVLQMSRHPETKAYCARTFAYLICSDPCVFFRLAPLKHFFYFARVFLFYINVFLHVLLVFHLIHCINLLQKFQFLFFVISRGSFCCLYIIPKQFSLFCDFLNVLSISGCFLIYFPLFITL